MGAQNNAMHVSEKSFHIFDSCARDKQFYLSDEFMLSSLNQLGLIM